MRYNSYKDLDAVALENNKLTVTKLMVELTVEINKVLASDDNQTVEQSVKALERFISALKEGKA